MRTARMALLGLATILGGCGVSTDPAERQALPAQEVPGAAVALPEVVATIREVGPEGWIELEPSASGPRRLRIDFRTVLELDGGVAAHWGDLVPGRRVQVWLEGGRADSTARRVVIGDGPDG